MTRVVALLTSLCALGICIGPARAQDVALRDGELALTVGYPLAIGATYGSDSQPRSCSPFALRSFGRRCHGERFSLNACTADFSSASRSA